MKYETEYFAISLERDKVDDHEFYNYGFLVNIGKLFFGMAIDKWKFLIAYAWGTQNSLTCKYLQWKTCDED